jgi:hypothetical protein
MLVVGVVVLVMWFGQGRGGQCLLFLLLGQEGWQQGRGWLYWWTIVVSKGGDGTGAGIEGLIGSALGEHGHEVGGIRTWTCKVLLDHGLERLEGLGVDVELPLKVGAHLVLHLVDLAEGEHVLGDDAPGLVRVRVVAHDLGHDHVGRDVETVTGRHDIQGAGLYYSALDQFATAHANAPESE